MNRERANPPALATWLLRHLDPKNQEALTGDLFEKFSEGHSHVWFWREVLVALALTVSRALKARWVELLFAFFGAPLPVLAWQLLIRTRAAQPLFTAGVHLSWPLSAVYGFALHTFLTLLIILLTLTPLFFLKKRLSPTSVVRAALISFAVLAPGEFIMSLGVRRLPHALQYPVSQLPFFLALLISMWMTHSPRSTRQEAA
jgi:hypothetical protein